ncbi:MAG: TonB-dependent receptor [Acidobacteria bacterium]|nr:TonB-dependent receptor [Acidobacteriota bacterium]
MPVVLLLALLSLSAPQQRVIPQGTSVLRGVVVDAVTQAPVAGARVLIVDLGLTARSGPDGRFAFDRLPGGSFTITVSQIGYIFIRRKVDLPEKASLDLMLPLAEGQGTYSEDVMVVAASERPAEPGVASQTTLGSGGLQSIRSVATDDPMRAVQALPGVTAGDDFRAEFSVRGASFRQMGLIIDGVATPMLVHTVKGRDDTGSIAMINTDVLDSASLMAGAQPQRDGNWLGGTLKFTVREGSRDRTQLRVAASITGAAAVVEGPLGKSKRASWLYSIRKSYADWLIRKLDPEFGSTLGFIDMQSKFAFDLTSRQQLQFLAVAGDADYLQSNTSLANGLHTANARSLVGSLVWRYARPTFQWSERVSSAYSDFKNFGLVGQNQGDGHTTQSIWRGDALWITNKSLTLEAGHQIEGTHDQRALREYSSVTSSTVRLRSEDKYGGDRTLYSAWTQATATSRWGAIIAGARAVSDRSTKRPQVAPWLLADLPLGTRAKLRAGVDLRVQYADLYQTFYAPTPLVPERATSWDLGVDVRLSQNITTRVNAYRRRESDILRVYNNEPKLVNNKLVAAALLPVWRNTLAGTSRGAEFLIQRKAATGLVGWVSYSYGHTRYDDTLTHEAYDGDFDQRHTVNVFLEARLSYRTAISAKVRAGSSPPLPGYFKGTTDSLFVSDIRNQVRLPQYLRIDARANRTFTYNKRRLTLFMEVINLTGRRNLGWAEGSVRSTFQAVNYTEKLIPFLPSIGILIEF